MIIWIWVLTRIEIQGRRANDIKHSASWEATQVFLKFFVLGSGFSCFFSAIFEVYLYLCSTFLLIELISGPDAEMHSLQSVQRQWEVYTWRVIENWGVNTQNILSHTLCHVATWDLTSRRQNGSSLSRRDVSLTTLCHVATSF